MPRQIITITGEQSTCLKTAHDLTQNLACIAVNNYKEAQGFLGQEFDAVIIDLHESFDGNGFDANGLDVNAFGAITGTIRGTGYLLLLLPKQLASSRFLLRFHSILISSAALTQQYQADEKLKRLPALKKSKPTATDDQNKTVDAIIHVVTGHRRRPLLITSDRGRGKSAALGIAAAKLLESTCQHISICAPSKKAAEVVFQHARSNHCLNKNNVDNENGAKGLTFYSVDELLQKELKTDLLLIDEAATIPLNRLEQLLKKYSRIVFSTTEHGYEGSGRGFAIRFRKVLDTETPNWQHNQLETPIRWDENDPLEQFVFDALLLNTDYSSNKDPIKDLIKDLVKRPNKNPKQDINSGYKISCLNKDELIKDEPKLQQLFALLVEAHYQTKPSDLHYLLDDETVNIFVIESNQHIIATALVAREGGLDKRLASQIFHGLRRPKGNLVAQALASSAGIEYAPCLSGDRIVRIAVSPDLQGEGLGTALLKTIYDESTADYVSASFGATPEVLSFWKKSEFITVNVGLKRDASSGSHSVIVLKAKTQQGKELQDQAQQRFCQHFLHLLAEPLNNLEADLALLLFCSYQSVSINETEIKEIESFATQQRAYENTLYPIWKLVRKSFASNTNLSSNEQTIIVLKILQKHSWKVIADKMSPDVSGKKMALRLLRRAIFNLLRTSEQVQKQSKY